MKPSLKLLAWRYSVAIAGSDPEAKAETELLLRAAEELGRRFPERGSVREVISEVMAAMRWRVE